ncbi:hypothetical protein KR52_02920 [Synechococcus sp. KORDI-52]|nr:hypothetical protein KR52_02920 [Synechococcus sp. KORDI-52]
MGMYRGAGSFYRVNTEQLSCHARANDSSSLNRGTVKPLGLKGPNRNTAIHKRGLLLWVLQLEQSRRGSRADDALLLGRRAIHQPLDRNFRVGELRTPFVTDSAKSEN